ncbi:MAG: HAD-IIIC family phosphatase [archaeon]
MENSSDPKKLNIAFLSNFTLNGLFGVMEEQCKEEGIEVKEYFAPYNQFMQEILNTSSRLYFFNPKIIFIILDIENYFGDFFHFPYRIDDKSRKEVISKAFEEIKYLISILKKNTQAKIVFNSFLEPLYSSRGILENKNPFGFKKLIRNLNSLLEEEFSQDPRTFLFDTNSFYSKRGYENIYDPKMDYLGDIKMSPESLQRLAKEYISYIYPLTSNTKKCIVLDLDNTLWGGVVGEEGIDNIKLGPDKEGKPFLDFQKKILELFERGIILAINSKNNYEDAMDVLKNHKHMLLKEDHFASMRINWQNKASNILEIAKEIGIGVDSLVFIDDDETNRKLVKEMVPGVTILDLPEDPSLYRKVLENLNCFNTFSLSEADTKKGEMYVQQKKRKEFQEEIKNIDFFLKKLEIVVEVIETPLRIIPRIAQLTQKTNQFNLTTKRYFEEDIGKFISSENHLVLAINVKDIFGDYGITGLAIIKKQQERETWEIDTFLLSCRILGKNIEFALMDVIVGLSKKEAIKKIVANFIPTKKNKPSENFLEGCGFVLVGEKEGVKNYILEIDKKVNKELLLKIEGKEWNL